MGRWKAILSIAPRSGSIAVTPMRYLVTGATGFVGRALASALLNRSDQVVIAGRRAPQDLLDRGACFEHFDLDTPPSEPALIKMLAGIDGVFHVAAKVKMWGALSEFMQANVYATEALLKASRCAGVPRFVYTSSPSVIAAGGDLRGVNESVPYPKHFEAAYPETKALAEQAVLSANGNGLYTAALRPHLIFGPGDTNLVPTIVARAKAGRLMRLGVGDNVADFTFIDDCVQAHLCAMQALDRESARGRAYFISQGDPFPLWKFIDEVVRRSGLPALHRRIPGWAALTVARGAEWFSRIRGTEPLLTRFLVQEMLTSHYFDISAARTYLGFVPSVTVSEGLDRTFPALSSEARSAHLTPSAA